MLILFFSDCLSGLAGLFGSIFLVNGRKWFDADSSTIGDAICYPAGEQIISLLLQPTVTKLLRFHLVGTVSDLLEIFFHRSLALLLYTDHLVNCIQIVSRILTLYRSISKV